MNLKRLILLVMIFTSTSAFAQSAKGDPVYIDNVTFKQVSKNDVSGFGGPALRGEVTIFVKDASDPRLGAGNEWVRNVEVELLIGFQDQKNKANYEWMSARAKIFAAERNKKTPIVFYIPWESYSMYRISREPDFYEISLFVNNNELPLSPANVKQRVSKNIKNMDDLGKFRTTVGAKGGSNKGVLKPLNECAMNIQYYEYFNNSRAVIPTYLDVNAR